VLVLTSTNVIPANAWTHVALTRAGSLLTAYVNAVADPRTGNDPSVLDHGGFFDGVTGTGPDTFQRHDGPHGRSLQRVHHCRHDRGRKHRDPRTGYCDGTPSLDS